MLPAVPIAAPAMFPAVPIAALPGLGIGKPDAPATGRRRAQESESASRGRQHRRTAAPIGRLRHAAPASTAPPPGCRPRRSTAVRRRGV